MGRTPAQQAGRVAQRVSSLVAGLALAVLMVQSCAARKAQHDPQARRTSE